jgi:hypothetical protein
MVATVFRGDRSNGPYLTRFGYHGTHFLLDGGYRPHDDREVGFPISERKTTQTPHPSARDGSGIPLPRDHISVASLGPFGASYILGPVVPAVSAVCRLLPLLVDAKVHSGIESCLCAGVYFGDTTICWRFLASSNCKNASVIAVDYLQTLDDGATE